MAPLRLAGKAKGGPAGAGIDLRLDANRTSAALAGTLDGPAGAHGLALVGTLIARDTADLLLALGWPAPADRPALGPLDLGLEVRRGAGPYELSLRGAAGVSDLSGEATIDAAGPRARVDGQLRAKLLDTALLTALYETAALPLAFAPGRPWLWPGRLAVPAPSLELAGRARPRARRSRPSTCATGAGICPAWPAGCCWSKAAWR